jgi:hypothetical protein
LRQFQNQEHRTGYAKRTEGRRGYGHIEDAREFLGSERIDVDAIARQVEGKFMSVFVRAKKPRL